MSNANANSVRLVRSSRSVCQKGLDLIDITLDTWIEEAERNAVIRHNLSVIEFHEKMQDVYSKVNSYAQTFKQKKEGSDEEEEVTESPLDTLTRLQKEAEEMVQKFRERN